MNIYFLESDYQNAEKYADIAIRLNRYNAQALVNKGNCLFISGDYVNAKAMYLEAVGVEADCVEAIYNLGLVNMKLGSDIEAKQAFNKLHSILPKVAEALFQIGYIIENMAGNSHVDLEEAGKTYENILKYIPADPNLYHRLGLIHERLEDENFAKQWHEEAHRIYPVNLNVISWLGVWYVKREMYEEAIKFFDTASDVQPGEVKWRLMVASCHRRNGDYFKALELYQQIYENHPDNMEALQYLEALCKDLGRPHDEYSRMLEKVRRSQPQPTGTGQMTRAGGAGGGGTGGGATQAAPQRSDRPKPERPSKQQQQAPASKVIDDNAGRSPLAAPRAGGQGGGPANRGSNVNQKKGNDDDDDFGDTDVGSLLG
jgi:intraflagellar transport protein 88